MLDQLVESKSNSRENARKSGFLLTTFVVLSVVLLGGWVYSLFALDYGLGAGDLELSALVAPVQIAEEAPPPPEPEQPKEKIKTNAPDVDIRTEIIKSMSETPTEPPDKTSTAKQNIPPRDPNKYTIQGSKNYSAENAPPSTYRGPVNESGNGLGGNGTDTTGRSGGGDEAPPPPPPPPVKTPTPKPPPPKTISGGVVNGKAKNLVTPAYPAAAKAVRASGAVNVQVTIDESGNVISAKAVTGHPLLRSAAESAARASKFSATELSGQPVKVTGVIIYNFTQ